MEREPSVPQAGGITFFRKKLTIAPSVYPPTRGHHAVGAAKKAAGARISPTRYI